MTRNKVDLPMLCQMGTISQGGLCQNGRWSRWCGGLDFVQREDLP